ncbi:MAG: AsmA family protein, partial [Gammaproteobacteria bacterium]
LDENAGTASIAGLVLALSDLKANLDANVKNLNEKPEVSGRLDVPPFSPRKLLAALGNPLPTSLKGFDKASLSANLAAQTNSIALNNLKLTLDATTLTGSLGVPALDRGALRFRLAADKINLDDYLVTGGGAKTRVGAAHGKSFMATRLPGRLLKKLDLAGQLSIGQLSGFGLDASDLALTLNAANGTLHADPIQAKLYSGSYDATLTLAAAGQGVSLATTDNMRKVNVGKLIGALSGQQRLTGIGDMKITLKGEGDTVGELMNTLKGNANLSLQNGAIEGINLWDTLRRAWLLIKEHKQSAPAAGPKRTQITNLKAHASIDKGKLINDALVAELPFMSVTGHGVIDFLRDQVDYSLLATVIKTPTAEGKDIADIKGLEIPLSLSGSLSDFSAAPDIKEALKARVESAAKRKLDQEKDKLKKKLLQELMGGGGNDGGG